MTAGAPGLRLIGLSRGFGDGQRRASVMLPDAGELEAAKDRPLHGTAVKNGFAQRPVPNRGQHKVQLLVGGGDGALDAVHLPGLSGVIGKSSGRNSIAGAEGSAVVNDSRVGEVGVDGQTMICAHIGHGLQTVVVGVADVAEGVGYRLERVGLEERSQCLTRGVIRSTRASKTCERYRTTGCTIRGDRRARGASVTQMRS